jgi:exoribonuclease II
MARARKDAGRAVRKNRQAQTYPLGGAEGRVRALEVEARRAITVVVEDALVVCVVVAAPRGSDGRARGGGRQW